MMIPFYHPNNAVPFAQGSQHQFVHRLPGSVPEYHHSPVDLQSLFWNPFNRKERDQKKKIEDAVEVPIIPIHQDDSKIVIPVHEPTLIHEDHLMSILAKAKEHGLVPVQPELQSLFWNPFNRKERD